MTKDIKDYLHLYLGCEVMYTASNVYGDTALFLERIRNSARNEVGIRPDGWRDTRDVDYVFTVDIKPILRPLSDMTVEEAVEVAEAILWRNGMNLEDWPAKDIISAYSELWDRYTPEETQWLLSKGFDLFGLIEAGLAIDATTIKQNA